MDNTQLTDKELEMAKKFEESQTALVETSEGNQVALKENDKQTSESLIETQKQKDLVEISQDEGFQKASKELNFREVHSNMTEQALKIEDKELNNEYQRYTLKKKKELLDQKTRAEKGLIKKQVQAEKYEQERKIAEKRFGYLYKTEEIEILNDNGEKVKKIIYKDFTTSKSINRFKEFINWYNNLTETLQKLIWKTFKFFMSIGAIGVIIGLIYGLIVWAKNSGILAI